MKTQSINLPKVKSATVHFLQYHGDLVAGGYNQKSATQFICLDEQSGIKMIPPQTSTDHALPTLNFQIFSRLKHN